MTPAERCTPVLTLAPQRRGRESREGALRPKARGDASGAMETVQARVLVVMGVSGSGKSTAARLLADRLSWDFAEGDDMHPQENTIRRGRLATTTSPCQDCRRIGMVRRDGSSLDDMAPLEPTLARSSVADTKPRALPPSKISAQSTAPVLSSSLVRAELIDTAASR
jgi:hypothetical protein